MKKIDRDGILLCELQATAFESSIEITDTSSEIFVRRFMHSEIAKSMDTGAVLDSNIQAKDIISQVNEQYGVSGYGSRKYTKNEMYWIGYVYRYFAYTYDKSSIQVYRIIKTKELRELFLPYHTMDSAQAIERILEVKCICRDEKSELKRQYEIYRRIRANR